MKIVLVIDQFDDANNGTTISARRFAQALKNHGNEVRVIATGKPADYKYAVRQMRFFPVVEHLITSQGMRLAIPNRHVFEKAAAWADVVHFMMPSPLGIMGLKHVEKLGIPHTAAFHCQPENITFTLHMGNSRRVNDFVYNRFRDTFFNRFTHIHCPSNMIANQLRQHGYTARLHVISNGISPEYIYGKREKEPWLSTARKSFPTAQRRSNSTYYQNFSELQLETILAAHVQQAVLGVCSPEEALKQAQEDCNRYFQPW